MKSISVALVSAGVSALAQQAHAEAPIQAESSKADQDLIDLFLASSGLYDNDPAVALTQALGVFSAKLSLDGEPVISNDTMLQLAATDSTSNTPSGGMSGGGSACYTNCYLNCHSACHGSRGWR